MRVVISAVPELDGWGREAKGDGRETEREERKGWGFYWEDGPAKACEHACTDRCHGSTGKAVQERQLEL